MTGDALSSVPEVSERRYEDLVLGERFGPFDEPISPGVADRLRGEVGVAIAGSGAPLGLLPALTLRALRRALRGIIPGGVLIRQRFAVHAQVPAAGILTIEVVVSRREQIGTRLFTTFTFACRDAGAPAATVEWTILAPDAPGESG
jgi:hypothetical protein